MELKHIVEGDKRLLPAPTASENGKVLKVVSGVASWQSEGGSSKANMPSVGALSQDASIDEMISAFNTLLGQLKGSN